MTFINLESRIIEAFFPDLRYEDRTVCVAQSNLKRGLMKSDASRRIQMKESDDRENVEVEVRKGKDS